MHVFGYFAEIGNAGLLILAINGRPGLHNPPRKGRLLSLPFLSVRSDKLNQCVLEVSETGKSTSYSGVASASLSAMIDTI
jgi:hypothetical protein